MTQGAEFPAVRLNNNSVMRMTSEGASFAIHMEHFDFDKIIGFDALYESMLKCKKGVMWKDSTAGYVLNGIERTMNLEKQLHDGTYKAGKTVNFRITSPKPREIASITFRDRVYQRSLNDNAVYPIMSKSFILDNYACQKGKGTDTARDRLKEFLHRYYRKHGNVGYVAQFDIHGYYPDMSHAVTEGLFRRKLPEEVADMVVGVLRHQYDGDAGYNPGSQLIQIAEISVLDEFDHYMKEQLHAKLYIRYMDDFLVIADDEAYLKLCQEEAKNHLAKIGFELNPKKTRIYHLSEGIDFLGFHYSLTETGKVLMTVKSSNVKRERRKLRRLVAKSKRGGIPRDKVDESYASWRNHASKGNSYRYYNGWTNSTKNCGVNDNEFSYQEEAGSASACRH